MLCGCGGRAELSAVPFSRNDITEQEPLIVRLPTASTCVWFTDDAGRVNVAMRHDGLALLGKYSKTSWVMSMRLGQPPAGRSLRYRIERAAVRGICTSGLAHQRFDARWGVLVLDRQSLNRFRGRFQIASAQQQFTLFSGWSPAGPMAPLLIMVGEFEAVHDEKLGRALIAPIQQEDWSGMAPSPPMIVGPASRSTTRPSPATRPR